ncbi:MAG: tetratricopeptide repeat protein [Acidobacteriota bacterium]
MTLARLPSTGDLIDLQRSVALDDFLGSDRRYGVLAGSAELGDLLCRAARARQGERLAYWHLDLEGFEPESRDALKRYLLYLFDSTELATGERNEARFRDLRELADTLATSDWSAMLLSLLWQVGPTSLTKIETVESGPGALDAMLRTLTDDRALLLHVAVPGQLRPAYRRWLDDRLESLPNFWVVLSQPPGDAPDAYLDRPPVELDTPPIATAAFDELVTTLGNAIDQLVDQTPGLGDKLRAFLTSAALCGRNVPAEVIFASMDMTDDEIDQLTDLIDDHLVDELELLADLGQRHPGFPGTFVYQFRDRLFPRLILDRLDDFARARGAATLLPALEDHVDLIRREVARLHLTVAEPLDIRQQLPYSTRLDWWIGPDEVEALARSIHDTIDAEELDPEWVWRVAEQTTDWPAYRRLALLEGYATAADALPERRLLDGERAQRLRLLRAPLLIAASRHDEALAEAETALGEAPTDSEEALQAQLIVGNALRLLGRFSKARHHFEAVLERLGETPSALTISARIGLSQALAQDGDTEGAIEEAEKVLEIQSTALGDTAPETVRTLGFIAGLHSRLGQPDRYAHALERLLAAQQELAPETDEVRATMSALAAALYDQREHERARELQEQVLGMTREAVGDTHPETAIHLMNLAATVRGTGDAQTAKDLQIESIEIMKATVGLEHPVTRRALTSLADTHRLLGEDHQAAEIDDTIRRLDQDMN